MYFEADAFNVSSPTDLTFISGSIRLGTRLSSSANITTIDGYLGNIMDVGFELATPVSWRQESTRRLGVFYIQGSSIFDPAAAKGWLVGFFYTGLEYGLPSFMVGHVNKPTPPAFVVNSTWTTIVSTPITPFPRGVRYTPTTICTSVTVTRVDSRKAEICLAVTNDASKLSRCASSAVSGRLSGIFMDSFLFNTVPELLTFENGSLKVQPSRECWLPYNPDLQGDVEVCGEAGVNGINSFEYAWSLALKTSTRFTSPNQQLGCFYATNIPVIEPLQLGWNLALAFEDLPSTQSQAMAERLFAEDLPETFTPRSCALNTIVSRVADGDGGAGDKQVCTKVDVGYNGGIVHQVGLLGRVCSVCVCVCRGYI
jgi:hypothetical protein